MDRAVHLARGYRAQVVGALPGERGVDADPGGVDDRVDRADLGEQRLDGGTVGQVAGMDLGVRQVGLAAPPGDQDQPVGATGGRPAGHLGAEAAGAAGDQNRPGGAPAGGSRWDGRCREPANQGAPGADRDLVIHADHRRVESTRDSRCSGGARDAHLANPARDARLAKPTRDAHLAEPSGDAHLANPALCAHLAEPASDAHLANPARGAHLAEPTRDDLFASPAPDVLFVSFAGGTAGQVDEAAPAGRVLQAEDASQAPGRGRTQLRRWVLGAGADRAAGDEPVRRGQVELDHRKRFGRRPDRGENSVELCRDVIGDLGPGRAHRRSQPGVPESQPPPRDGFFLPLGGGPLGGGFFLQLVGGFFLRLGGGFFLRLGRAPLDPVAPVLSAGLRGVEPEPAPVEGVGGKVDPSGAGKNR